jgi:tetratricopeptide (TPR) repeat protein
MYHDAGDVARAVRAYREAIRLDAELPRTLNDLAWLFADAGTDLDEAVDLATRAVGLEPHANHYDTLAWALYKRGDLRAALTAIEKAANDAPDDTGIRSHHATIRAALDE